MSNGPKIRSWMPGSGKTTPCSAASDVVQLSDRARSEIVKKKATCPFIGAAIATGDLPVRNDALRPLASIDDVVALGNSGGGDLGEVLKVFAEGNHSMMPGASGRLDRKVPAGLFSLDFPGSQGSHPGHSGILQGNPNQLGSGRFSSADFDRLLSRAKGGYLKRSDIGKFIAENLIKDPHSKVFGTGVTRLLAADLGQFVRQLGPTLLEKLGNKVRGSDASVEEREHYEALTKFLGEDNLVGSSGEFGLLLAFLENKPGARKVAGEPAISVDDLRMMFKEGRFPPGWETWPKTRSGWITNTTALLVSAGKEYLKLKTPGWR